MAQSARKPTIDAASAANRPCVGYRGRFLIATPPVTRLQFAKLSLPDIQALGVALDFFSAPLTARAEMLAALVELGYLSESDTLPTTSLA